MPNVNQDLDQLCEELIREEFRETCNFDVDDAIEKLEKLGIVTRVRFPFLNYIIIFHHL